MRSLATLLDFHLSPTLIFAFIGGIIVLTVAVIAFWGFEDGV